jgi:hypothetical protein
MMIWDSNTRLTRIAYGRRIACLLPFAWTAACTSEPEPEYRVFKRGEITVKQAPLGGNGALVSARFKTYRQLVEEYADPCTRVSHGACVTIDCPEQPPSRPPTTVEHVSAGLIRVEGGIWDAELSPYGTHYLDVYDLDKHIFLGGEPMRFVATGDVVPAFDGVVEAPQRLEIMPRLEYCGSFFNTEFTWSGGAAGEVFVSISDGERGVECRFDAAAGAFTIPAESMELLGPNALTASVVVESTVELALDADWLVMLRIAETRETCGP